MTLRENLFSLSAELTHRGILGSETVKAAAIEIKRMEALAEDLAVHAFHVVQDATDSKDDELLTYARYVRAIAWQIVNPPANGGVA